MDETILNHYLNSARGWVELGNCIEASKELDKVESSLRTHPDTLEIRCRIFAKSELWTAAYEMALAISEVAPGRITGWIYAAESLCKRGETRRAKEILTGVVGRFPRVSVIPYKLACYCSQLQSDRETERWLHQALRCDDFPRIADEALAEPALKRFRKLIRERLDKLGVENSGCASRSHLGSADRFDSDIPPGQNSNSGFNPNCGSINRLN